MRVLVTGGLGFIGHHLVEVLLHKTGWDIVILDGLTYAGDTSRVTSLHNYDPKRVSVIWHDLRAPINSFTDNAIGNIDYVLDLASESHVDRSIIDPVSTIQSNVSVVLNLFEWAKTRDIKKIYSCQHGRWLWLGEAFHGTDV